MRDATRMTLQDPRLYACTHCGMAPMPREVAVAKLEALAAGGALARERFG